MQNDKLLNCPFCNGMAKLTSRDKLWDSQLYCATWVECEVCGAKTFEVWNPVYDNRPNEREKEVIEKWNKRRPMERIVEQLESLCKYNSEQAEIYHNAEKQDAHTREMKDLYIDRANCYGVAIRTVKGGVENEN